MTDADARTTSPTPSRSLADKPKKPKFHTYPFWSPRFWHGMRLGDWWRLLCRNRFRMALLRIPMAVLVTMCAVLNTLLHWIERWRHGRRIEATEITQPPVFIIGHWRSGTTYLHELLVRDDRFAFPTTYECFASSHFLVSEWIVPKLIWFLLPSKRPMDNMAAGFDRPQEDEFALVTLGAPTPYLRMAVPNDPPPFMEFLDMQGASAADVGRFRRDLRQFAQRLTLLKEKRLILKSPPHTGRIALLADLFPGAVFIHIVRDPYSIFASTRRLWQSLDEVQGFQFPKHEHLDEYVFAAFERMYRGFDQQRSTLDPARLYEIRYEDLVQDPLGQLETMYAQLNLGDFAAIKENIAAYLSEQKDYQTNRHELAPSLKAEIRRRWSSYFDRYGYE